MYLQLTMTPEWHLVLLLLTLNILHTLHYNDIAEFEQKIAGWTWELVVLDNKFAFINCDK